MGMSWQPSLRSCLRPSVFAAGCKLHRPEQELPRLLKRLALLTATATRWNWLERPGRGVKSAVARGIHLCTFLRRESAPLDDLALKSPAETVLSLDRLQKDFEGRYTIFRQIGQGSWATVYRAEQLPLGRSVALKILHGYL